MKGIKLLSLFVFTLISLLLTRINTHDLIDWSVNTSQDPKFQQLPPEISQPIPAILAIQDENLIRLRTVIGYLPIAEQNALAVSYIVGGDRLFNTTTYFARITSENIYKSSYQSLSSLLTTNSKMFRYGLGCVKKVAIQFGGSQIINDYAKEISTNLATLINSQLQVNNCESRFAATLMSLMISRRRFLLTTIINQTNAATYSDPTTMKVITGFKYSSNEVSTVIQAFNAYVTCHYSFRYAVYTRVLESEQLIGKFDGCRGLINYDAGSSSKATTTYVNNVINENNEVIGKNFGFCVRTDLRTQNNYLLQGGFGLGSLNLRTHSTTGQSLLRYPLSIIVKTNTILTALTNRTDYFSFLNDRISANLKSTSEYRPTPNLHDLVLKTFKTGADIVKAEFAKVERGESCTQDYMLYCTEGTCTCPGTTNGCSSSINFYPGFQPRMSSQADFDSILMDHDYTFTFTNYTIAAFCLNKVRYIYADATSRLLGKVIDFIIGGSPNIELGNTFASITQSCFGVFTNGAKDDKDACRDVFSEKCGIEMDYRCKQSGLYDYINQNPISKKIMPVDCDTAVSSYKNTTCFNWIAQNFFLGTVALKTTGFLSLNLNIQSSVNQGTVPTTTEPVEYHKNDNDPTLNDTAMLTALAAYNTGIEKEIVVDGAYNHHFPRFSEYLVGVDHEAITHEQSGDYIKTSLLTLMLIFFIGLIF